MGQVGSGHSSNINPFSVTGTPDGKHVEFKKEGDLSQVALFVKAKTADPNVRAMETENLVTTLQFLNYFSNEKVNKLHSGDVVNITGLMGGASAWQKTPEKSEEKTAEKVIKRPEKTNEKTAFKTAALPVAKPVNLAPVKASVNNTSVNTYEETPLDPAGTYAVKSGDTYWNISGRLMSLFPNESQKKVVGKLKSHFKEDLKADVSNLDMLSFLESEGINPLDADKPPVDPMKKYSPVAGDSFYSIARRLKRAGQFTKSSDIQVVKKLQGYFGADLYPGVAIDIAGFIRGDKKVETPKKLQRKIPVWEALGGKGPPPAHIKIPNVQYGKTHKSTKAEVSGYMDKALKHSDVDVPKDMWMKLSFDESSHRPYIQSPVGALGLGQLMPRTARAVGLEVSDKVDERFDPEKNLLGSGRYLTRLHKRFGNWEDVLVAYNCGPTCFAKGRAPKSSYNYSKNIIAGKGEYAEFVK